MKRILILICVVCMLCGMITSVYAATAEPVLPLWDNADRVICTITFSGTEGNVQVTIIGNSGTTSISGTATLYCGDTEIDSWNISGKRTAIVSDTFTGVSGSAYKLVLDVDVTTNGVVENVTEEDSGKCP